jgi:hypothetical protein
MKTTVLTVLLRCYTKYNVHSGIVKITEEKELQTWVNDIHTRLVGGSNLFPAIQSMIFNKNIHIKFFTMYTYSRQKRNINSAEKDKPSLEI